MIYGKRIKNTIISKDPVFILGHYRSGTTYLQKLLVSDKRLGFLTYYDALFPNSNLLFGKLGQQVFQKIIDLFKIKNPFFHNSILQLDDPDEEDDYLMNKASGYSSYWGLIFPKCRREWLNGSPQFSIQKYYEGWEKEYLNTVKYATFKNRGKQLVLKSPPNTERISMLLQMFPEAKFIYIYRNPFQLFYSVKNMWKNVILKYYSLQHISEEELNDIIFEHFIYLTEKYEKEKHFIPEESLVEISYEELKSDSFGTIQKIYSKLELPEFEITTNDLLEQLKVEKDY
ncbi:MAG TPA: sulfotransferase, partial [Draconibacterium sp.]|nr:sulfotransferase [Draconibacterium sp.]